MYCNDSWPNSETWRIKAFLQNFIVNKATTGIVNTLRPGATSLTCFKPSWNRISGATWDPLFSFLSLKVSVLQNPAENARSVDSLTQKLPHRPRSCSPDAVFSFHYSLAWPAIRITFLFDAKNSSGSSGFDPLFPGASLASGRALFLIIWGWVARQERGFETTL